MVLSRPLHQLGILAQNIGDYGEARRLYEESLNIEQGLGDKIGVATTLHNLGALAQVSDLAEARRLYQESIDIKQELGDISGDCQFVASVRNPSSANW